MTLSPKELCLKLMKADTGLEVKEILTEAGYWDNTSCWRPFGDNENNFGSIGNQQSDAVAALVEKIINSIDARLMGLAAVKSLTPTSANCPQNMREAIAQLVEEKTAPFGERDGNIFYWTDAEIKRESKNISLFATGKAAKDGFPSLTISDSGEGQTPDRFPDTFMSLAKQNKLWIPFVQGKFNMGGTGVFQFCSGDEKIQVQLTISRRNPALLNGDSTERDNHWGFTIVRRVTREGMKNPLYEYLAPLPGPGEWGAILSFASEALAIFPSDSKDRPVAYAKSSNFGTLVKLYEYTSKYAKTNITFKGSEGNSLKVKLEEALPEAALPIQIAECRPHFQGRDRRSFEDEILGAVTQLGNMDLDGRSKQFETVDPITGEISLDGSPLPVKIFVFKEDLDRSRYNSKGVYFTINGQTHGSKSSNFFNRKKVNLSYIKESLLVVVNCTELNADIRVDLFMNSRDRMRDNVYSQELEEELEKFLSEDQTLQTLNRKRHQDRVTRSLEDQKSLEDTLKKLVKGNPLLAELLPFGMKIPTDIPGTGTAETGVKDFRGKRTPTYFRFKGNQDTLNRGIPINQQARITLETDASNNYFSRKSLPGHISIEATDLEGNPITFGSRRGNLKDGLLHIVIKHDRKMLSPGAVLLIRFRIEDENLPLPFVNELKLTILKEEISNKPGTKGTAKGKNVGGGNEGANKSAGLPSITAIEEHDWAKENFTADTAVRIKSTPDGPGYDFFYNKDNRHLKFSQLKLKQSPNILDYQYKIGLLLFSLAIIAKAKEDNEEGATRLLVEENIEAIVAEMTDAVSPYWLSVLEGLSGSDFISEFAKE